MPDNDHDVTSAEARAAARQAAAEARRAALRERVREEVATWPPLSDWQRERLRALFDLSDEGTL